MGPQMAQVSFSAEPPSLDTLKAEAMRLGNIAISNATDAQNHTTLTFADFPKGCVTVSRNGNQIFVADLSLVAPVLFELLVKAAVELGGSVHPDFRWSPLSLPLSKSEIRSATRRVHFAAAIGFLALLSAFAAVIALVAGIFRVLSRLAP